MKIRTFKFIDGCVYRSRIYTEDWSQGDKDRVCKFGDPEINLGGKFYIYHVVTGWHTSASVHDYIVDENKNQGTTLDFYSKDLVGRTVRNITKNFNGTVSGWTDDPATTIFVSTELGNTWDYADQYEIYPVYFTLPDRYRRVKADSPFEQRFDALTYNDELVYGDDGQFLYTVPTYYKPVANIMAKVWSDEINARLEASVAALRAYPDSYTGEELRTI